MWTKITDQAKIDALKEHSFEAPVVIYKHSNRCSISRLVLNRIEAGWNIPVDRSFLVDVVVDRNLSLKIASDYDVHHESPQILVISSGKCSYHSSHMAINVNEIDQAMEEEYALDV